MPTEEYERVKKDFLSGRLKGCKTFFESHGYFTEAAYCCIILDKLDKAQELFSKSANCDIRAHWGLFLIQLLTGEISRQPTYFEIRNFLEIDINILILYCKGNYVEHIMKYTDFMAFYNPECYKFMGRVFWANNLMKASMYYLMQAKDKFYTDPELHYLLGYIYYTDKDIPNARKSLENCLRQLPEYAPATKLLKEITAQKY